MTSRRTAAAFLALGLFFALVWLFVWVAQGEPGPWWIWWL